MLWNDVSLLYLTDLFVGTGGIPGRSGLRSAVQGDLSCCAGIQHSRSFAAAGPKC